MNRYRLTLPAVVLAITAAIAGCGKDEPENKPRDKNFGAGLGESYNQMLDQARQSTDAANQQMQDTEQRVRDAQ